MNKWDQLIKHPGDIEKNLGYTFANKSLLALAFVHRSFLNENQDLVSECNERLEFLGDSVLGLIISEDLYRKLPATSEGELSSLRSHIVDSHSCKCFMEKLKLEKHLMVGKGERLNQGRGRESVLADFFEAIIGAIFLDGGIDSARHFLFLNFTDEINALLEAPQKNWKALFQDKAQKNLHLTPEYRVLSERGPDHEKVFEVAVYIGEREMGRGEGGSKKEAQQAAAKAALERGDGKA